MKRALVFTLLLGLCSAVTFAGTHAYTLNDAAVEQMFEASTDVTPLITSHVSDLSFASFAVPSPGETSATAMVKEKSPVVAFLLAFFLGGLGIHRFYLGTKTMTGIGYILTCGGFGIVAFVDWILLLIGTINDDIDKYVDNPKFFMW